MRKRIRHPTGGHIYTMVTHARFELETPILERSIEGAEAESVRFDGYCLLEPGDVGLRFWISDSIEQFEPGLADDETVAAHDILSRDTSARLYQIRLSERGRETSLVPLLGETGGDLLDIRRTENRWSLHLRFPDHASLQRFAAAFGAYPNVSIRLERVSREERETDTTFGLTPLQYEALETAFERGYFDVPRNTSLQRIAAEMDVSDQAVSERLRRAQKRICARILSE